jgi:hypothetical protein
MRRVFTKVGLAAFLVVPVASASVWLTPEVHGALIRPDAAQSFPDLAGDIVGTQSYTYNSSTNTGVFQVQSAPSLLALGPQTSSEYYVYDLANQARSQSLQVTLDSNGQLVNSATNSYSLYGSVTVNGQNYNGLLLQGTPTAFGFAPPNPAAPTMGVYDVNIALTGGLLEQMYGGSAYMRIISETNSTFSGSFTENFSGLKTMTNVRSYNPPAPAPIPEPSTFAVLLACGGAGLLYRRRIARVPLRDLRA